MEQNYRKGTLVQPLRRLSNEQVQAIHKASLAMLSEPGVHCFNKKAVEVFQQNGCSVEPAGEDSWKVRIPAHVVDDAVRQAPDEVLLGARDESNTLKLNANEPLVYFGTGSETNIFLDTEMEEFVNRKNSNDVRKLPVYVENRGNIANLCKSAKLCNRLDNVDFFIRNVNIQDEGINESNKDVNVFFASLLYMQKHVMAGLTDVKNLDTVLQLAELISGGRENFIQSPLVSFITCIIKSPLQMVDDTTEKMIAIAKKGAPVVLSSSPQGGSTAPVREEGMVAMINAEILAGITLAQLVNPGAPVLYGAVPVRARLDNLHDLYGAPEFVHYNQDCIQMAEYYGVPCYSTAGVGDAKVPGMQATIEKVFSQLAVAQAGAQYIHYAFGLLDKTNVFSPLQAVLDDEHIGIVRQIIRQPVFGMKEAEKAVEEVRQVTASSTQLFARYIRKARKEGLVSAPYAFETPEKEDLVLSKAYDRLQQYWQEPANLPHESIVESVYNKIEGLLPFESFQI